MISSTALALEAATAGTPIKGVRAVAAHAAFEVSLLCVIFFAALFLTLAILQISTRKAFASALVVFATILLLVPTMIIRTRLLTRSAVASSSLVTIMVGLILVAGHIELIVIFDWNIEGKN